MTFRHFLERALSGTDLDWKRYQRASIRRRVYRLCAEDGFRNLSEWLAYLDQHVDRHDRLLQLFSVSFSRFFRDQPVFQALANRVLPSLAPSGPLRVWSAGCACGQEIYSVAMVCPPEITPELLGTDVNPRCLAYARRAVYTYGALSELPGDLRLSHFEPVPAGWRLRKQTLPPVRFLRHDLLTDPYPEAQHLILCRNTAFTYFTEAARLRVARRLIESLAPGGYLVLGKGESLPASVANTMEEDPPASGCHRSRPA